MEDNLKFQTGQGLIAGSCPNRGSRQKAVVKRDSAKQKNVKQPKVKQENAEPTPPKGKAVKAKPLSAADNALEGWTAIARYLGIPVATAHRWASEGMPIRREGRFTVADRDAVSAWLGRESHMPKPAHVMTEDADMAAALKESIAAVRKPARNQKNRKKQRS
jgi:hypothetical protein